LWEFRGSAVVILSIIEKNILLITANVIYEISGVVVFVFYLNKTKSILLTSFITTLTPHPHLTPYNSQTDVVDVRMVPLEVASCEGEGG
jgi:hypothetical protein